MPCTHDSWLRKQKHITFALLLRSLLSIIISVASCPSVRVASEVRQEAWIRVHGITSSTQWVMNCLEMDRTCTHTTCTQSQTFSESGCWCLCICVQRRDVLVHHLMGKRWSSSVCDVPCFPCFPCFYSGPVTHCATDDHLCSHRRTKKRGTR